MSSILGEGTNNEERALYWILCEFSRHCLCSLYAITSQSTGLVGFGFKNLKAARAMLSRRFPFLPNADPPLAALPYITPQTVSYALSAIISYVCYAANDPMTMGSAELVYKKLIVTMAANSPLRNSTISLSTLPRSPLQSLLDQCLL